MKLYWTTYFSISLYFVTILFEDMLEKVGEKERFLPKTIKKQKLG